MYCTSSFGKGMQGIVQDVAVVLRSGAKLWDGTFCHLLKQLMQARYAIDMPRCVKRDNNASSVRPPWLHDLADHLAICRLQC